MTTQSESAVAQPAAEGKAETDTESRESKLSRLEEEGDIAADYLEGLLDIADLDGDIDMDVEGDRASVSVVGDGLGHLVGKDGEVLEALQELTRLAVTRETGERTRMMLDIGGHRAARRAELIDLVPVRAQGRTRYGGRGRAAQRVGGRGAQPQRGRVPGLAIIG